MISSFLQIHDNTCILISCIKIAQKDVCELVLLTHVPWINMIVDAKLLCLIECWAYKTKA